jgi:pimeloyl-ACP methyl ester carboxylesterase
VWDLVRPRLERRFEVIAPALPGHLGGPPIPAEPTPTSLVEHVERTMDEAGFETAYVAGNSLGGHVALQLAGRGRARAVTAFAPAGGWEDAAGKQQTLDWFTRMHEQLEGAEQNAAWIASTPAGRRRATAAMVERFEHIPPETVAHIIRAAALCRDAPRMIEIAQRSGYPFGAIECPLRIVWGTEDKLLPWPSAAARFRRELPHADWVILDGVGHCPQLELPLETAELIFT